MEEMNLFNNENSKEGVNVLDFLIGETLLKVEVSDNKESIYFVTANNKVYDMHHDQDCCEEVAIEQIDGDLQDIVGCPLIMAEESTREDDNACESGTWSFYKFATSKGYVTIRWYGSSNGYYSEEVGIEELDWVDDSSRIEDILKIEYDNIIPELKNLLQEHLTKHTLPGEDDCDDMKICTYNHICTIKCNKDVNMKFLKCFGERVYMDCNSIDTIGEFRERVTIGDKQIEYINYIINYDFIDECVILQWCYDYTGEKKHPVFIFEEADVNEDGTPLTTPVKREDV